MEKQTCIKKETAGSRNKYVQNQINRLQMFKRNILKNFTKFTGTTCDEAFLTLQAGVFL